MNKKAVNILMGSHFCFISASQNYASVNMYIMCTFLSVPIELIPRSEFVVFKCYHYLIDATKEVVPIHLSLAMSEGFYQELS